MTPLLEDMKYDFMPKTKNKIYHVVSAEWFKQWRKYVGLDKSDPL
jgi:hypothetical protein